MKKTLFKIAIFAVITTMTVSCNHKKEATPIEVDSDTIATVIDSVDSDSVIVDSVVVDSTVIL